MEKTNVKKRWLSVYVENEVGVLARVAGLFSGKLYNLNSLTVGETEQADTSRMTISLVSDDRTFEQVKHQLNNMVEVIQVLDYTDKPFYSKEVMYTKVNSSQQAEKELAKLAEKFVIAVIDRSDAELLVESLADETTNDALIFEMQRIFPAGIEVVRGGSVAIAKLAKT